MECVGSCTKAGLDRRLVGVVREELRRAFPPQPSERAALVRASRALGMSVEALRPHYRGEVQRADAALIAACRLIRGAKCLADWLEG